MKNIILILAICAFGYPQKEHQKKEIVSIDAMSITYDNKKLYIDVKNKNLVHFQIWKNKDLILNAKGNSSGTESFPASKGKYKIIVFTQQGQTKTRIFYL